MQDTIMDSLLEEVYVIDELDRETNTDFLLDMSRIKEGQDQDQKPQDLVCHIDKSISLIGIGKNMEVYTVKGKVWVPARLQARIIDWYLSNLHCLGVTCAMNS